jgi:hypothetical protein
VLEAALPFGHKLAAPLGFVGVGGAETNFLARLNSLFF